MNFIKCECVSPFMKQNYGLSTSLTYSEARQLEAQGHVRMADRTICRKHVDNTSYIYRTKFSKRKRTRIAWIQNYHKDGGAEISNFQVISVGTDLGYDVVGCDITKMNNFDSILAACDIAIVNNLHDGNHDAVVEKLLASAKPYIIYSHDCFERSVELFQRAALIAFISPAHRRFYLDKCGDELAHKSICLPLAIDHDRWNHGVNGRIPNSVLVVSYEKCRNNVIDFIKENPQYDYYVAGGTAPLGAKSIPHIFYNDMPDAYRKYEKVLHLPTGRCAGDRVLFEAVLSGCKVITNTNAGHMSWSEVFDWRDEKILRAELAKATFSFWRAVDKVLLEQVVAA